MNEEVMFALSNDLSSLTTRRLTDSRDSFYLS